MTCEQALELMSPMLDGELDPKLTDALNAHLETCPDCKRLADTLRGLDEQVSGLREPAPEGLKKGVLYRIDQATGKAKKPVRRWFGPGTAIGAVAAVLVLLVGIGVIPLGKQSMDSKPASTQADARGNAWSRSDGTKTADNDFPDSLEEIAAGQEYDPAATANEACEVPSADSCILPETSMNAVKNPPTSGVDFRDGDIAFAEPDTSEAEGLKPDNYFFHGGESAGGRTEPNPLDEETRSACAKLSEETGALVLVYTEFDPVSLFGLLETEQPELWELVKDLEMTESGDLLLCETDCRTALALQEWLLEKLPRSEDMDPRIQEAETNLRVRMEVLDPGSESLCRVITWETPTHPVPWPDTWPEAWADRVRTEENWALFFPSEDYTPNAGKTAYLVFAK